MGEQLKMLTRTVMVCLLATLTYQKATQKNHTISLRESNQNPRKQENLLRGRRSTNLPPRITFRTEIAMTRRMLNQFNGNKRQAENWVNHGQLLDVYNRYMGRKYPLAVFGLGVGAGIARFETACPNTRYGGHSYMILSQPSDTLGGVVLAHEIGHMIGMRHNEDRGCGSPRNGLMNKYTNSYSSQWTSCNNEDLEKYYNEEGGYTCL